MRNKNDLPTHFGDVRVARLGPRDRLVGFSPIEHKVSYINNLSVPVIIEWENGFKFTLPKEPCLASNTLTVRIEIVIHAKVKNDVMRILSVVDENASNELKAMREAFEIQFQENNYGGASLILDYPITLNTLRDYGGSIYSKELNSVISIKPYDETPPHPFGITGKYLEIIDSNMVGRDEFGFNFYVELIDNTKKHGDRYLNIGNKVYKVSTKKDSSRRDGIYVISNRPANGELVMDGMISSYYCFDNTNIEKELGLYKTSEEALSFGDMSTARKQELVELEQKLKIDSLALLSAKHEHERNMIEQDKKMKELELEQLNHTKELQRVRDEAEHKMILERARLKDEYEERSYMRKDSTEVLKFIPALIVGLGAVLMTFKTVFK